MQISSDDAVDVLMQKDSIYNISCDKVRLFFNLKIVNVIWVCWNIRDSPGVSAGLACTRYRRPSRTVDSLYLKNWRCLPPCFWCQYQTNHGLLVNFNLLDYFNYFSFIHYLNLTSSLQVPLCNSRRHDLTELRSVGRGNWLWIIYILFDHTRKWSATPDEGSVQCRGHSETTRTWKTVHTIHAPIQSNKAIWKDDYDGQKIFGDLAGLKLPDICLTGEEKPRKNLTEETVPTGIELGPAAWQARLLPPPPQWWTISHNKWLVISERGLKLQRIIN